MDFAPTNENSTKKFFKGTVPKPYGTTIGSKIAVAFANIFMSKIETEIISKSKFTPLEWKRYIDVFLFLWDTGREALNLFILEANTRHPTIKFTAEISDKEITFLDITVFKGEILRKLCP